MKASFDFEDFIGALVDRYIQPLLLKVNDMSQQVTDLKTAVDTLTTTVTAAIATESALKAKLDAALATNVDLQTKLDAALANAGDPADAAALAGITSQVTASNQALADANAVNAPAN